MTYDKLPDGAAAVVKLVTTISVEPAVVTIEDEVAGDVTAMRATWPMLVFDGAERTRVEMSGNTVTARLGGRGVRFAVIEPAGAVLIREGRTLAHRNGEVEPVSAEVPGRRIRYEVREASPE